MTQIFNQTLCNVLSVRDRLDIQPFCKTAEEQSEFINRGLQNCTCSQFEVICDVNNCL